MSYPTLLRHALLAVSLATMACAMVIAGTTQLADDGTAGEPHNPSSGAIPHQTTNVSYGGVTDALGSRFNSSQISSLEQMASGSLGIDLASLDVSGMSGQNSQMLQWTDPTPQPTSPTTNWEIVSGVTPDGMTVTIHTQITGPEGIYGSNEGGGGTGTAWISITDADGNNSWLQVCVTGGEFVYQAFHTEQLVRDNATVIIDGPDTVVEDEEHSWSVSLPDSNLPEETDDLFEVRWSGPLSADWTASPGNPGVGTGEIFSTIFTNPGTGMLMVDAQRSYSFKVFRTEPNPTYVEGVDPVEEAFIRVESPMTGLIRGSAVKSVTVEDITPPELTLALTASHGATTFATSEDPRDQPRPKTIRLTVTGMNLSPQLRTEQSIEVSGLDAVSPVAIGPHLDPSLGGFFLRVHERFTIQATARDNHTPQSELQPSWFLLNEDTGEELLPPGTVEHGIVRRANEPDGDRLSLTVSVADRAGNETVLVVPLRVLDQAMSVRTLDRKERRHP